MRLEVAQREVSRFSALYIVEARFKNMFKWRSAIITAAILNPVLYLLSVGVGIGSLIDAKQGVGGVDGVPYLTFLAPALLASAAIQGAIDEVTFPTLQGFKWAKNFFAMNSTPITGNQIALGVYIAALCRTFLTVVVYWFILLIAGALPTGTAWLAMFVAMLAGGAFGSIMLFITSKVEKEDFFLTAIGRLIIMPLFLFSGTFYPLSSMPLILQPIGWISPLWHATELGRYLTYGHSISGLMIGVHFIFLTSLLALGLKLAFRNFTKRLSK